MLQEDSNGEASFEIIEKKNEEASNNGDKTESLSSVSSAYSIPSPSVVTLPGGNLLSNLPPPSNLPDITFWQSQGAGSPLPAPAPLPLNLLPPSAAPQPVNVQPASQPYPPTQFSAAIPPSKGIQHGPLPASSESQQGGGLIGWMRDAVATGGILSKVAEKAKNSVDTLITTLDPQMSEFVYSGGDVEISVASEDPEEIGPIREAIYSIFGKAWVNGVSAKVDDKKRLAVGFEEGVQRAEEKANSALQTQKKPTISLESILLKQNDQWFDLSVILLRDPEREISVHTFTQTTPIPKELFLKQAEKEMPGYAENCNSEEKLLSAYLRILNNDWQQKWGASRRDTIYLASKTLVSVYKNKLEK